jgi:hypothetical protein
MDPQPKVTRIYRCRECFSTTDGARFRCGELLLEDHPAVMEYPQRFEPDTLDPVALVSPPQHLVARGRRPHVPETPPSWWAFIGDRGSVA